MRLLTYDKVECACPPTHAALGMDRPGVSVRNARLLAAAQSFLVEFSSRQRKVVSCVSNILVIVVISMLMISVFECIFLPLWVNMKNVSSL